MKAVIYVRTSTEDQEPSNQIKDCMQFAESRGYEVVDTFVEKLSGYKQIERPYYNKVKEMAHRGQVNAVIVWALDRWVRNRDTLIEDVSVLRNYNCKLHSIKDAWLESINVDGPLGKTIQEFLLGLLGSLAQMESDRKSERVKLAVRKKDGITVSYKGKKWGRRSLPLRVTQEVLDYHKAGKSIRWIAKNVYYYDKNKNKKYMSIGSVHKIVHQK